MATPSSEGPSGPQGPLYAYSGTVARMPIPGNAELAVYLLVWFVIALCWIIADSVNTATFCVLTVILTFGYLISRGIAKASRVLEQ